MRTPLRPIWVCASAADVTSTNRLCTLATPDADKTAQALCAAGDPHGLGLRWRRMPFAGAGRATWAVVCRRWLRRLSRACVAAACGQVVQATAQCSRDFSGVSSSVTDPPYYDNIGYSDLSDFFYVWLRRSLRDCPPRAACRPCSCPRPKNSSRTPTGTTARMARRSSSRMASGGLRARPRDGARRTIPITVYYAFKQSESDDDGRGIDGLGDPARGDDPSWWEITVDLAHANARAATGMIAHGHERAGFVDRAVASPAPEGAPTTDRRGFIAALESELPDALRKLQQGQIAPVDLPQAAIGPGMAVFSRYGAVLEPDGSEDDRPLCARRGSTRSSTRSQRAGGRLRPDLALRDRLVPAARLRRRQVRRRGQPCARSQHQR